MSNSSANQSLRTVKLFEFYVRNIWPFHRRFVRDRLARRCHKCALSEKKSALDESGLCEFCRESAGRPVVEDRSNPAEIGTMAEIIAAAQGRGGRGYDALVLFSGGKDSAYLIRRIQNEFPGLRMVAFTINNGFMSPLALENIQELLPKLDVDHLMFQPAGSFYVNLFRYCITHLNAEGGYGTVDFSDGEFMMDTARHVAAEKEIPLILVGYSRYQVQNGLHLHHFESPRERELSDRTEVAGIPLSALATGLDIRRWWNGSNYPPQRVARVLFPLYAWDMQENEIKNKVAEWGLISKRASSPIATNHQLIPLLGVVDVHKFGYASFEIEFCRMIREGKANRDEWQMTFELLEYTARTGLFVKPMILDSLARLKLTTEDVGIRFEA